MTSPTVLLVHGAMHGSWCWRPWSEALDDAGIQSRAITLPDHDRPGDHRRIWTKIRDHVHEVHLCVEAIDGPVVVVGHSMGAAIARRLLDRDVPNLRGVALLAPFSPRGAGGAVLRLLRRRPVATVRSLATGDLLQLCRSPEVTRRMFFSDGTPGDVVADAHALLQNESIWTVSECLRRSPPALDARRPILVIGGRDDGLLTVEEQQAAADSLGAELHTVAGGHDIMLDVGAGEALEHLRTWLATVPV